MKALEEEIVDGAIVAISTGVGRRIVREEMVAAAMRVWPQDVIEEALGADAARVMPGGGPPRRAACAHAEELSAALPELNAALAWPSPAYDR